MQYVSKLTRFARILLAFATLSTPAYALQNKEPVQFAYIGVVGCSHVPPAQMHAVVGANIGQIGDRLGKRASYIIDFPGVVRYHAEEIDPNKNSEEAQKEAQRVYEAMQKELCPKANK